MSVPLRADFDAAGVRTAARNSKDAGQTRRLLALAGIYDGATRTEAARIGGVTLQIVRDWVMMFNAQGPAGLIGGKAPGKPRILTMRTVRRWGRRSRAGPSRPCMAWCAGGSSTFANGCTTTSRSAHPSRR